MTTKKVKAGSEVTVNASEHTPTMTFKQVGDDTSWFHLYEDGLIIAQLQTCDHGYSANNQVQKIVRAVNSHEALLSALHAFVDGEWLKRDPNAVIRQAKQAIAKAEGK